MRVWFGPLLAAIVLFAAPAFAQGHGPALWRISRGDTEVYLFGSIHTLKPGTQWLSDDLRRKISSATAIYMELSAEEDQPEATERAFREYAFLPKGDSLRAHLPAELYTKLAEAFDRRGWSERVYDSLKPWAALVVYGDARIHSAGYRDRAGVEETIEKIAKADGVPIRGLETLADQFAALDALSDKDILEWIEPRLGAKDQKPEDMDQLTQAWSSGDIANLAAEFTSVSGHAPVFEKELAADRNANWTPKIEALLDEPGKYLVVVGTGHLVGPDSLIALLQKDGITVERVN
jgi:uncharacterized protein YbaP (TraB family)